MVYYWGKMQAATQHIPQYSLQGTLTSSNSDLLQNETDFSMD